MSMPSLNLDLRVGGIAPSLLRELSGVYPTFVSAFKELVSNAYDADAENVRIELAEDLSTITVEDDGIGMTPFDLHRHYLRIGGSGQRSPKDRTPGGRQPIGRKGIGFLAIARYCTKVEILTHARRREAFVCQLAVTRGIDATARPPFLQDPLSLALSSHASVSSVRCGARELSSGEYEVSAGCVVIAPQVRQRCEDGDLTVGYYVDCGPVDSQVVIDYDYLFGLDDKQDLSGLNDFCSLRILPHNEDSSDHFSRVTLHLQESVRRELLAPRKSGGVRNIASSSGLDQFLWRLGRCTPVSYELPKQLPLGLELLDIPLSPTPFRVHVSSADGSHKEMMRPVLSEFGVTQSSVDVVRQPITIEEDGLSAQGYLLGFPRPVFPAELRGIAVRVRGVEIGRPSFMGAESVTATKLRPLLSQVVGEIIVTRGMDALDSITPGREGFYVDSEHFRALRRHLIGDEASDRGALGALLQEMWHRRNVDTAGMRIVQEARQQRDAFLGVAHAVTALSLSARYGTVLRRLFTRIDIVGNGLSTAPRHEASLPESVADYRARVDDLGEEDYTIDNAARVITFNGASDIWDDGLHILGRDFRIDLRDGAANGPLCELDFSTGTILVNWLHATRSSLGLPRYIKSALCWRIAYLASEGDIDLMMNLAHRLLSADR